MGRDLLIGIHAATGTLGFAAGVVLIAGVLRGRVVRPALPVYAGALLLLAATTAVLVGWDWPGLRTGARGGFAALVVLAAVMAAAAVHAAMLARGQPPVWRRRFVTAVGFTLIALFDGFAIITALDAGSPSWAIVMIAVAAVLAGRRAVQWAEHKAASQPADGTTAGQPPKRTSTATRPTVTARRIPSPMLRAGNRLLGLLHHAGLHPGPMQLLTVAGRKTGRPHTTPVAPVTVDGTLYLLEAFPGSDWVKNARAAGHGTLRRGRAARLVRLTEVPQDQRAPILREFPRQNRPGVRIFISNGVVPSGDPDTFAAAAPHCPVFRAEERPSAAA